MAMIEKGKLKRVRRKLLQDQLTLAEALKYAQGLESADQHAVKVENQTLRNAAITIKKKTVLIRGIDIMILPDSGAKVNAMNEAMFKKYDMDERVKIKKSRCQIKPYGADAETNAVPVFMRLLNRRQNEGYVAANKRRHPHRTIAQVRGCKRPRKNFDDQLNRI